MASGPDSDKVRVSCAEFALMRASFHDTDLEVCLDNAFLGAEYVRGACLGHHHVPGPAKTHAPESGCSFSDLF